MNTKTAVNLLTLSRIALGALFAFALMLPNASLTAPFAVYALACASDILDGRLARRFGVASPLGAALDVIADVTLLLTAYITMAASGLLPWWMIPAAALKFGEFWCTSKLLARVQNGRGVLFFDTLGKLSAIFMLALPLLCLPLHAFCPYPVAEIIVACVAQVLCLMAAASSIYRVKRCAESMVPAHRQLCCKTSHTVANKL